METNHIDKRNLSQKETTLDKAIRNGEKLYPSIQFRPTSSNEIEKTIKSLKQQMHKDMMKFQLEFLNGVLHLLALHLHTFAIDL
jgi:hypothetical protein